MFFQTNRLSENGRNRGSGRDSSSQGHCTRNATIAVDGDVHVVAETELHVHAEEAHIEAAIQVSAGAGVTPLRIAFINHGDGGAAFLVGVTLAEAVGGVRALGHR